MTGGLPLRFTDAQVTAFAAASGDVNPLHVDAVFARSTPFGRPIVHGALVTLAALAAAPADRVRSAGAVTARFARPAVTGVTYRADAAERSDGRTTVTVREGDLTILTIELTAATHEDALPPAEGELPSRPEQVPLEQRSVGDVLDGSYRVASPAGLRALAEEFGTARNDALLGALAWGSWFVGMRLPGRDALFTRMKVVLGAHEPRDGAPRFRAELASADPRTGSVLVRAACTGPRRGANLEMLAVQRPPVPPPTRAAVAAVLPPGDGLKGRSFLVVGGSRGIGAAIVAALASQGASVWATQRAPGRVEGLRAEFGANVQPLVCDAGDAESVARAFDALPSPLDGLVLSAGPAVLPGTIHPDTVVGIRQFVDTSVSLALVPLSAALARGMTPGGRLVFVSSSTVEDWPAQWPHYGMAKSAAEALVRHCAVHEDLRALVARPPKMWTDMSNGPLGRVGAIATEHVAAAIARWTLAEAPEGLTVLGSAELAAG